MKASAGALPSDLQDISAQQTVVIARIIGNRYYNEDFNVYSFIKIVPHQDK
jgi:hypothetical protein